METELPPPPAPAKTERPERFFPEWVGVLLSLIIAGAGQFMAGRRMRGLLWQLAFWPLVLGCYLLAALPVFSGFLPATLLATLTFLIWLTMLWDAYRSVPRFKWLGWLALLVVWAGLGIVREPVFKVFLLPFRIPTGGMAPTLLGKRQNSDGSWQTGDHLLVLKCSYWFHPPKRGDLIVFKTRGVEHYAVPKDQFYIKRLVAFPGERVAIINGRIHINGAPVQEPAVFGRLAYVNMELLRSEKDEFVVPPDCYFALGDNSANSLDSRYWGGFPRGDLVGQATKIFLPLERAGVPVCKEPANPASLRP